MPIWLVRAGLLAHRPAAEFPRPAATATVYESPFFSLLFSFFLKNEGLSLGGAVCGNRCAQFEDCRPDYIALASRALICVLGA